MEGMQENQTNNPREKAGLIAFGLKNATANILQKKKEFADA